MNVFRPALLVLTLWGSAAFAEITPEKIDAFNKHVEAEVKALDPDRLLALYTDDATLVFHFGPGKDAPVDKPTKKKFEERLRSFRSQVESATFTDKIERSTISPDKSRAVVVSTGSEAYKMKDGKTVSIQYRSSATLVEKDDKLLISRLKYVYLEKPRVE